MRWAVTKIQPKATRHCGRSGNEIGIPSVHSLKLAIEETGFDLVGITPAVESIGHTHLLEWIEAGFCGEMGLL